jgi:hypothetical protein
MGRLLRWYHRHSVDVMVGFALAWSAYQLWSHGASDLKVLFLAVVFTLFLTDRVQQKTGPDSTP